MVNALSRLGVGSARRLVRAKGASESGYRKVRQFRMDRITPLFNICNANGGHDNGLNVVRPPVSS